MTKKIITYLLAIMCICTCFIPSQSIWANEPGASIQIHPNTAEIGQEITVTLTFTNDTANISKVECNLSYNDTIVEALSESGGRIVEHAENPTDSLSVSCSFRVLAEGTVTFAVQDCILSDETGAAIGTASASATFTVSGATQSSNANLQSLTISSGTLQPAFSSDITEYAVSVPYTVETITISAITEDANARTSFDNPPLGTGSNQRVILVTAQDGTQKTYTLNITREASPETATPNTTEDPRPTQTQKPTTPPVQTQIQWGTPAQDVTDAPDSSSTAGIITQPSATTAPTVAATPSDVMTVDDLKNASMTMISIVSVIIVVILFTVIYCMQQNDNKKNGKKKKK